MDTLLMAGAVASHSDVLQALFQKADPIITLATASSSRQVLSKIKKQTYTVIITQLEEEGPFDLLYLKKLRQEAQNSLIIAITSSKNPSFAVSILKNRADDCLFTPCSAEDLFLSIQSTQNASSQKTPSKGKRRIIAESQAMKEILLNARAIAKSRANVFITGESGTGKEVIANFIHQNSERSPFPYVKVNCAAIPETLIETEFFGHEKGAFTGASETKEGRFEVANKGTLLLDEISETPPSLQAKLLRVTQDGAFERIGSTKTSEVDVRLISTSNRPVQEMLQEKILRTDLFFRLNVIPIQIPPLRERPDDILPLALYFLELFCKENDQQLKKFSKGALDKLLAYYWPGNVRELANIIERAVVLNSSDTLSEDQLLFTPIAPNVSIRTLDELKKEQILEKNKVQ